jgi:hypothetical protein
MTHFLGMSCKNYVTREHIPNKNSAGFKFIVEIM